MNFKGESLIEGDIVAFRHDSIEVTTEWTKYIGNSFKSLSLIV